MHKDILAAIVGRNKAVALGIVEPLHRSGRHVCCSSQRELDGEAVVRRATAIKNPLLAVSLSGSCGAATSGLLRPAPQNISCCDGTVKSSALDACARARYDCPRTGVVVARWPPRSSKSLAGRAERAAVGSTPIHPRLHGLPEVPRSASGRFYFDLRTIASVIFATRAITSTSCTRTISAP